MVYLGWCKINCSFALLKFAIWYRNIFLTKSGYVMHPFNTFGSGTANECTVQWWFEKFCRGDESLEVEERSAGHWKPTVANWEHPSNQILLQLHKKLPENSKPTISQLSGIWTKLERWKSSVTGCPLNWLEKNPKNYCFEVLASLILCNNESFLDHIVTCEEKWVVYDNRWQVAEWLDQAVAPEHAPESNLPQKKVMLTAWWSTVGLIHYSFLNPSETITPEKYAQQIDERHWKLHCLQPALVNRKGPVLHDSSWLHVAQPMLQKLKELGYKVLPHPPYSLTSHQPLLLQASQLFAGKMLLQPPGGRKSSLSVCKFLKYRFLCSRNNQTYSSLAKMCWL